MIVIPSMDNYIIQYEGKRWEEEGLMTKRHPMACHDPSSWSFGVKAEIFSSLGQKERLRAPKIPIEVTCLLSLLACGKPICGAALAGESVLAYFGVMYYNV